MAPVFASRGMIVLSVVCALLLPAGLAGAANTLVTFNTSLGDITVELYDTEAPISVQNFLQYVDDGAYTNSFFQRMIPNFVVQAGGFTTSAADANTPITADNVTAVTTRDAINLEYKVPNSRGTIAMARSLNINSATSQYYFNLVDNDKLLGPAGVTTDGYAVFGEIVTGLDVLDKLASAQQGAEAWNASAFLDQESVFDTLPLVNYSLGQTLVRSHLEMIYSVSKVVQASAPSLPAVQGDFNGDGAVDDSDLATWSDSFGWAGLITDNPLGLHRPVVDQGDYTVWADSYGTSISTSALPEPASLAMLLAGGLAVLRRRTR